MGHIEDFDTIVVDDRFTLKVDTRKTRADRDGKRVTTHVSKAWWLLDKDVPVVFLKTLFHTGGDDIHGGCPLVLCDIEVRFEHRGQGHTHRIVAAVEKIEGYPMWTLGGFTPLGAQALSWIPVYPWEKDSTGIQYDDMEFVEDWDTMQSKYAL